jgi:hypothetical protein
MALEHLITTASTPVPKDRVRLRLPTLPIQLQIRHIGMQLLVDFNYLCIMDSVDDPSRNPKL